MQRNYGRKCVCGVTSSFLGKKKFLFFFSTKDWCRVCVRVEWCAPVLAAPRAFLNCGNLVQSADGRRSLQNLKFEKIYAQKCQNFNYYHFTRCERWLREAFRPRSERRGTFWWRVQWRDTSVRWGHLSIYWRWWTAKRLPKQTNRTTVGNVNSPFASFERWPLSSQTTYQQGQQVISI